MKSQLVLNHVSNAASNCQHLPLIVIRICLLVWTHLLNLILEFSSSTAQVEDVQVSSISSTSVIVSWDPVSLLPSEEEEYNVSYRIYYSHVGRKRQEGEANVTTSETSVVITGLTPGTEYQIQVAAIAQGNGVEIEGQRSHLVRICDNSAWRLV